MTLENPKNVINNRPHEIISNNDSEFSDSCPPWIEWFLAQHGHDIFVEVDEEYILDRFNLTGLTHTPHFQKAHERLTKREENTDESEDLVGNFDEEGSEEEILLNEKATSTPGYYNKKAFKSKICDRAKIESEIQKSAIQLYGLIHARYIITMAGMEKMLAKFKACLFGKCPRVYCRSFALLPIGLSDSLGKSSVMLYCAHCDDIYRPRSSRYTSIDGAYFGTSFPHLFFLQYKDALPIKSKDFYTPKIFGFRLYANQAPVLLKDEKVPKTPESETKQSQDLQSDGDAVMTLVMC